MVEAFWTRVTAEALANARSETALTSFYSTMILNQPGFAPALAKILALQLDSPAMSAVDLRQLFDEVLDAKAHILEDAIADARAYLERDPAIEQQLTPLLHIKGYHALQIHRVAHHLWTVGRRPMALFLQNRSAESLQVDIHPAASIGTGIMLDHATGIVIGETAQVGDHVSLLHSVTLGGTGCQVGDRHPRVNEGVLLSAGAKLLGPIVIGAGSKVGAGSVVTESVPPHSTVVGVPSKVVGNTGASMPGEDMC